jgi:hypothetical protein
MSSASGCLESTPGYAGGSGSDSETGESGSLDSTSSDEDSGTPSGSTTGASDGSTGGGGSTETEGTTSSSSDSGTSSTGGACEPEPFDNDPGWVSFNLPNGANDFGYQTSAHAGGAPGEVGGAFQRSDSSSYYADLGIEVLTADDAMSASGTLNLTREDGDFDSPVLFGYFSSAEPGPDPLEQFVGVMARESLGGGTRIGGQVGATLPFVFELQGLDIVRTWSFSYDPNAGTSGEMTFSVSGPDGGSNTAPVSAADRAGIQELDAFGILLPGMAPKPNSEGLMEVYFDDLDCVP